MKCEDCGKQCDHYMSTSYREEKDGVAVHQTKLYFRCPNCHTVYVNVLIPQPVDKANKIKLNNLEKYPYIEKYPVVKVTLDKWM